MILITGVVAPVVVVVFILIGFFVYKKMRGERFKGAELMLQFRLKNLISIVL